jgi:hypothetical protein
MLSDKERLEDTVKKQVGWQQQLQNYSSRAVRQHHVTGRPALPAVPGQPQTQFSLAHAASAYRFGYTLYAYRLQ